MSVIVNGFIIWGAIYATAAAFVVGVLLTAVVAYRDTRRLLRDAEHKSRLVAEACQNEERYWRDHATRLDNELTDVRRAYALLDEVRRDVIG
jgi:predicted histidine transporter YuiF (NhaC family)